jgi:hypothetical protein
MTVGALHGHGGRNYDELMEMSGEPQHHGHHPAAHAMVPAGYAPPAYAPTGHAPQHHAQHAPPAYAHATQHAPPAYAQHATQHEAAHHEPRSSPMRRRIVEEEPTHERLFPIGFVAIGVAAGDEVDIEVKPQVYFRGERLAIPQTIARYFDIVDIKVGKDSQLAATGSMPGESFSTVAVGVRMELSTAKPGIVITLRVRNVDTGDQDFKAVMYGCVLE